MPQDNLSYRLETMAVHAGQTPDQATGSRAVPIYQTTSFVFPDTDYAARLFSLEEKGDIYTRISNPTTEVFEKRMAALERGVGAMAVASGQMAVAYSILTLAKSGDEIISSASLYGGTYAMFFHRLPSLGINVRFVDPTVPEHFRQAITPKTKAIYAETIGNPQLDVLDIEAVAEIAHEAGIPLIMDNTFATPCLCRPFEFGADIVVHSATKWIGGHGNSIGGIIIDAGTFPWGNGNFPDFVEPDPAYHGVSYTRDMGEAAYITKARVQYLRDLGGCLSPFNAFLFLLGLETLPLRMERHSQNAQRIADFLQNHPKVSWVSYPGLLENPSYSQAQKYLTNGAGAMISFGVKGGRKAGGRFIDSLKLISLVANVGDAKSLVIHPATTTHSQLTSEQLAATGVTEDMIRLSVGLEHVDDLIDDLDRALSQAAI